ncbi:hypothetical protein BDB01DRAFT_823609, partial [Pilobolus umbonatus]
MPNNNFQPTSRRQRVKTPYETKRVYACGYCSKSFDYSHQLSSHMKNSRVCKSNAQDAISAAASSSVAEDIDQDISIGEFIDIDHEMDSLQEDASFDQTGATIFEATHMDQNSFCYMENIGL